MAERLTIKQLNDATPESTPFELRDSEARGLLLRVQPSGVKTFYVELKRGIRERLGPYPAVTLESARTRAKKAIGKFLDTGERKVRTRAPMTFEAFLKERYEPWVTAERKAGAATMAAIRLVWADLLAKSLKDINAWSVEKIKAVRLKGGTMPATVNRDLGRIKAALAKAVEWELLEVHPLKGVKPAKGEDGGRIRFLSTKEEEALRKVLDGRRATHIAPMVLLALNTGLRRGELTSLTWADINLKSKLLTVRAGYAKSGKARYIQLNSEAVAVLSKLERCDGRLFSVFSVKKAWASLCVDAKLSDFRFHDLRHTFASNLVMAGVDLNTVRELMGHADIRMTLRYAHLAPEHKAAAVEKLVR